MHLLARPRQAAGRSSSAAAASELLQRLPLFEGVAPEVVERLGATALLTQYQRGQHLWRAGEAPVALAIVRSGLVKVVRPTPSGRMALCGLFGRSSPLGEVALIKGIPYPSSTLAATKSVSVIDLPRAALLAALNSDPRLAINLLCSLEGRLAMLHDKIDVLSAGSVDARLATLLIKLYEQLGDELEGGVARIMVPLSRQELADLVATTFETAIRVLSRWQRAGIVSTDAEGFTLHDLAALKAVSGVNAGPQRAVRTG